MITVDLHNHLAQSDMDKVKSFAAQKKLEYVGFCEHTFNFTEVCDAAAVYCGYSETPQSINDYIANTSVSSRNGFSLLRGVELDLGGRQSMSALDVINRYHWDFISGGLHFLKGVDLHRLHVTTKRDRLSVWKEYIREQIRWTKSGLIDYLAHPLRLGGIIRAAPEELVLMLDRLTHTASTYSVPIEIDAQDFSHSPELVKCLITSCANHGAPITVGSDSTIPAEVGRYFHEIETALASNGIDVCVAYCSRMPVLVNIHTGQLVKFGFREDFTSGA